MKVFFALLHPHAQTLHKQYVESDSLCAHASLCCPTYVEPKAIAIEQGHLQYVTPAVHSMNFIAILRLVKGMQLNISNLYGITFCSTVLHVHVMHLGTDSWAQT